MNVRDATDDILRDIVSPHSQLPAARPGPIPITCAESAAEALAVVPRFVVIVALTKRWFQCKNEREGWRTTSGRHKLNKPQHFAVSHRQTKRPFINMKLSAMRDKILCVFTHANSVKVVKIPGIPASRHGHKCIRFGCGMLLSQKGKVGV